MVLLLAVLLLSSVCQLAQDGTPGSVPDLSPPQPKQLTVYAAQTDYTVPVLSHGGRDYAGLFEVLEPLGRVNAKFDGQKWKLRCDEREAQFIVGKTRAKIHKNELEMGAPFLAENGRGLVPLQMLPQILTEILPARPIAFHEQARRLFLDKTQLHYAAEMKSNATGQLVITFTAPVNPSIATEPGKLRMFFRREPLVARAPAEVLSFDDKSIHSLAYDESNGAAELTVSSTAPLLALFSPDRKVITIAPAAPPSVAPAQLPAARVSSSASGSAEKSQGPVLPKPRPFLVVIDAAHGGDDQGGIIAENLAEKDVVLSLARHLYNEFQKRGVASRLIRDNDLDLTPEQRAAIANAAVPSLYLALHAAGSGTGVHLFTSSITAAVRPAAFLGWDSAQTAYVTTSHAVATAIATELLKRDIPALDLSASLAPLDRIATPALAVEVAVPPRGTAIDVDSPPYQDSVCSAITTAVLGIRSRLPHGGTTP